MFGQEAGISVENETVGTKTKGLGSFLLEDLSRVQDPYARSVRLYFTLALALFGNFILFYFSKICFILKLSSLMCLVKIKYHDYYKSNGLLTGAFKSRL